MALSKQIIETIKGRADLKALYDFNTGKAKDPNNPKVKGIPTLTEWWNQYGKNEYPNISSKKATVEQATKEEIDYTKLPVPDKPQKDLIKGSLVKFPGTPKVYLVDEENGRPILRHVVSSQTIAKIPGTWSNVITLPNKYSKEYVWIPPTKKTAGRWEARDIKEGKDVKGELPFAPKSVKLYEGYGVDIPDIDKAIAQDLPKFAEQAKIEADKKAAIESRPDLTYNGNTIKPTDPNYDMYAKYGAKPVGGAKEEKYLYIKDGKYFDQDNKWIRSMEEVTDLVNKGYKDYGKAGKPTIGVSDEKQAEPTIDPITGEETQETIKEQEKTAQEKEEAPKSLEDLVVEAVDDPNATDQDILDALEKIKTG